MIYPELYIKSRANITRKSKGVEYQYNSRGFRDDEWPENLQDCIFIVGASTIMGYGSHFKDTLIQQLQSITNKRVINISLYSASNDWIFRKVRFIKNQINPKNIIVSWVYFHFAENSDTSLSDEDRRIEFGDLSVQDELLHFVDLVNKTPKDVIQTIIPQAHHLNLLPYVHSYNTTCILPVQEQVDYAIDNIHNGPLTTNNLAVQLNELIL